jgi:hypothetical protein
MSRLSRVLKGGRCGFPLNLRLFGEHLADLVYVPGAYGNYDISGARFGAKEADYLIK